MKPNDVETFFRADAWRNRLGSGLWIDGDFRLRSDAAVAGLDLAQRLRSDHFLTYADHATSARNDQRLAPERQQIAAELRTSQAGRDVRDHDGEPLAAPVGGQPGVLLREASQRAKVKRLAAVARG